MASNPIPEPTITGNLYFCRNTSSTPSAWYRAITTASAGRPEASCPPKLDATGEYSVVVMDSNGCIGNYAFLIEELEPTP